MNMIIIWLLKALALLIVAYFVPNIHLVSFASAMLAAILIGLVNMLIKPILIMLTLPITILTLGLFILVINGALFYAVGHVLQGFVVDGFFDGVIGAVLYSLISYLLTTMIVKK